MKPHLTESEIWKICLERLRSDIDEQQLHTWINPLQLVSKDNEFKILAPNRFVLDWVLNNYQSQIKLVLSNIMGSADFLLSYDIGEMYEATTSNPVTTSNRTLETHNEPPDYTGHINPDFTFNSFVEGHSNQLAKAASWQVSQNSGQSYNPLFIYGGVGLGKTHLMHATANQMRCQNPKSKIIYLHSERFVANMIKALQHNKIADFKKYYRSVDALLIDDIQFFAHKDRSQEEFFHIFNALIEGRHQIILTCDKYPKEVSGLEERLKSRFGWGLTVAVEPPELETRVAIIKKKAEIANVDFPDDVAFFIAKQIRSNVRELEGALRRVIATAQFSGHEIDVPFAKTALSDLISLQEKLVTLENIQKTVAEYYKIRLSDLHSSRRSRSITRPRQLAMYLSKEFTSHSFPEIGDSFGGRDHTTVIHACKKIKELLSMDSRLEEDYRNLVRILSA